MTSNDRMDTVGEEEQDLIKLKSLKNNKTFTVPQNDRVRKFKNQPSSDDKFANFQIQNKK